jgi:hypothetical protein
MSVSIGIKKRLAHAARILADILIVDCDRPRRKRQLEVPGNVTASALPCRIRQLLDGVSAASSPDPKAAGKAT